MIVVQFTFEDGYTKEYMMAEGFIRIVGLKHEGKRPIKAEAIGITKSSKEYFVLKTLMHPKYSDNIILN